MTILTRRRTLQAASLLGLTLLHRGSFAATAACDEDSHPTSPNDEGPFFKPLTPKRTSLLEPGMQGEKLIVTGQVLTTGCKPIANALLDFWHADHEGVYDNTGFKLRGHQLTDAEGRFRLETIMPGLYPGRTRHFHVKAAAPNREALTTQLYFPGERFNARDGLFRPDLIMAVSEDKKAAQFTFILQA